MDRIIATYRKIARLRPAGFWPGFIAGLIYFSYIFWWTWAMYPLDSLGLGEFSSFIILLYFFAVTVIGLSSIWGFFSYYIFRVAYSQIKIYLLPLSVASGFVMAEYLRSWIYGILWYGNNGTLGPHWTLGNPAYLFLDFHYLATTASFWGIYGIDFVVVFFITSLVLLISIKPLNKVFIYWILILFLLVWVSSIAEPFDNTSHQLLPIAIVQTKSNTTLNKSSHEIISDFNKKVELLKNASKEVNGGIVILPEGSGFSNTLRFFLDSGSTRNFFNNLSENETLVLDHVRVRGTNGIVKSTSLFISSKNGLASSSDKKVLTPAGEYLPFLMGWLPKFLRTESEQLFKNSREFSRGTNFDSLFFNNLNIKTTICSELFSPNLSRGNYDLIIGQGSLEIFRGSKLIEKELVSALRLRAIENNKPAVLSLNYGHSYIINSDGQVEKMTDSLGYRLLTTDIVPNKTRTWYNRLGDWPILLVSLLIFGLSLVKYRNIKIV